MSLAATTVLPSHLFAEEGSARPFGYKRSISHWTVSQLEWEDLCPWLVKEGVDAIDLVGPENWHHLKQFGLDSSMCNGAELNLVDGFIHEEFEGVLQQRYSEMIPRVAKAGYQNLI